MLLSNKVALITGGSRGIGKAIVELFVQQGCRVAFTYKSSSEAALSLVKSLDPEGQGRVKCYQSDAASFAESGELVEQVVVDFGTIDVLINNAGITRDNLLLRMTEEQWDDVINNNLKSTFNMCKQVVRPMLKKRSGSIINIGSVVGMDGNAGQMNYAASKAGMIGLSMTLAKELGSRSIRCNVIAPGFIETDMTTKLDEAVKKGFQNRIALKRFGTVEEVANTALFLASDLSSYITGQTIRVCGALN